MVSCDPRRAVTDVVPAVDHEAWYRRWGSNPHGLSANGF